MATRRKKETAAARPEVHVNGGVELRAIFDDELAALLAALITSGVRIKTFAEVKQTVENLYMRLSRHEVM